MRSEPLGDAPAGTKPVVFAAIPEFDQTTQYVYQLPPAARKSGIKVGVAVGEVTPDEASAHDLMMPRGAKAPLVEGSTP